MTTETSVATAPQSTTAMPVPKVPTPVTKPHPSVKEVVESVRADSLERPDDYLEDVYVPGGGE